MMVNSLFFWIVSVKKLTNKSVAEDILPKKVQLVEKKRFGGRILIVEGGQIFDKDNKCGTIFIR